MGDSFLFGNMKVISYVSDFHSIFLAFVQMKSYVEAQDVKQEKGRAALVWSEGDFYQSCALDHHTSLYLLNSLGIQSVIFGT